MAGSQEHLRPDGQLGKYKRYEELLWAIAPYVSDRVLDAMHKVDRKLFMDGRQRTLAYHDEPRFIPGYRGTASISQPSVVAFMTELLDVHNTDRVLEIGTGAGWQSAILAHLAEHVVTIEIAPKLARKSHVRHQNPDLGLPKNISVVIADGSSPVTLSGMFDKMIVTASMPCNPNHELFSLLKEDGLCVAPIGGVAGDPSKCELMVLKKTSDGLVEEGRFPGYEFVPMQGSAGWEMLMRVLVLSMRIHGFDKRVAKPAPEA